MNKNLLRWSIWIFILGGILLGISVFSLFVGSAGIPFKKIIFLLFSGERTAEHSILFDIRLPRIFLGISIGGALSLAGVILQGMFRNSLVEPYTLGISGGAALGVCLNISLGLSQKISIVSLPFSGFAGAVLVMLFLYWLNTRKRILKVNGLLLTGVMISFIASSSMMFIMSISRVEDVYGIVFWIMGSLEEPDIHLIQLMSVVSFFGLCVSYLFSCDLNALALGEEEAMHLGINTDQTQKWLFLLASLLTGCAVSVAGVIGFVGLVIPHLMRLLVGTDHRILLITSFLAGGTFLVGCDTLARTVISPMELPVGVITGIIGGGFFIYVLNKKGITSL